MKKILLVSVVFIMSAMLFFPRITQAEDLMERKLKECREHLSDASQWKACMNEGIEERAERFAQKHVGSLSEKNLKRAGYSKEEAKEIFKKMLIEAWETTMKELSEKHLQ